MKSLILVLLTAMLFACGGGGDSTQSTSPHVTIYGDSLMLAQEHETKPVQRIKKLHPDWQIEERFAGGVRLQQVIDGYDAPYIGAPSWMFPLGPQQPFAAHKQTAQIVVVQVGINDIFHDASQCERNMRFVITTLLNEGRTPVLTGLANLDFKDIPDVVEDQWNFCNNAFHALAKEFNLQHAGWDKDYRGPEDILPDQVHRTQEASNRLAALLAVAIERALRSNGS